MQHQQHDWFMTTLVNCVKNILLPSEARPHTVYIYILECSMVAEGPAADSRPFTLANIYTISIKNPH